MEGKEFLCADRFTIADIAVGYALFLGTTIGLDERYKPNCRRYLENLMARPAFQSAQAK
jgi:glutathione S-transferase